MAQEDNIKKFYLESRSKKTKFQHYPLKKQVIELLADSNFRRPTLVQAESLPITLQDNLKNLCIIVYAYNGAGKTLSYLIPILNSLQNIPWSGMKTGSKQIQHTVCRPQALIIVPTEALLAQIHDYLNAYAGFYQVNYKWNLKIGRIYSTNTEGGHIIVGLTKKMQERLQTSDFELSELKWIVFDECDKVKEDTLTNFEQILQLFSNKKVNTSTANLLITSATGDKESFRKFIQKNLTTHNVVELDSKDQNIGLKGVTHYYSKATSKETVILNLLEKLSKIEHKPQVIIFFNEIIELRSFYAILKKQKQRFVINDPNASESGKNNLKVDYIHSKCNAVCFGKDHDHPEDCSASKTTRITKLKNREIQVLLGTETIGRGIDIRTVSLVINYSEPEKNKQLSPIAYIHRVGRTGRYSDEGIALTFVNNDTFIKLTEDDQKIKFMEMKSEEEIIKVTLECSGNNQMIAADEKHRYEYE